MAKHASTYDEAVADGAVLVQISATGGVDYWTAEDTLPDWYTATPAPAIPDITSWQLTQALIELGLIGAVEALVAATADPYIKYGWQQATTYTRRDPVVLAAQAGMGLSDAQVDALFLLATSK